MKRRNPLKWALPGIGIALLAVTGGARAAGTTFEWEGSVRVRNETDDKSFRENADAESYTTQRTRLKMTATTDEGAMGVIHLQDARRWGEEGDHGITDEAGVDVYEAYLNVGCKLIPDGRLFFGRQALSYGRERVIGPVGWSDVGRAFDAARLHIPRGEHWIDLAYAKLSEDRDTARDTKALFLYGHAGCTKAGLAVEPFVIHQEEDPGEYALTSIGDYARYERGRVRVEQDFVYQVGTDMRRDVGGMLIDGEVKVDASPDADGQYGVIGGYSLYTGQDPDKFDEGTAYMELYPTGHKFHGFMDVAPMLAGGRGLQDIHGKAWYRMPNGMKVKGAFHVFATEQDATLNDASTSTNLGNEIDVALWYEAPTGLNVSIGGGVFLPGDIVKEERGEENARWLYLQGELPF